MVGRRRVDEHRDGRLTNRRYSRFAAANSSGPKFWERKGLLGTRRAMSEMRPFQCRAQYIAIDISGGQRERFA